jgi:hypothetical protein
MSRTSATITREHSQRQPLGAESLTALGDAPKALRASAERRWNYCSLIILVRRLLYSDSVTRPLVRKSFN